MSMSNYEYDSFSYIQVYKVQPALLTGLDWLDIPFISVFYLMFIYISICFLKLLPKISADLCKLACGELFYNDVLAEVAQHYVHAKCVEDIQTCLALDLVIVSERGCFFSFTAVLENSSTNSPKSTLGSSIISHTEREETSLRKR